jgi:hypothetical protein
MRCGKDYIINPATNRCVLKRGRIGQQLLKNNSKIKKAKAQQKLNPRPTRRKRKVVTVPHFFRAIVKSYHYDPKTRVLSIKVFIEPDIVPFGEKKLYRQLAPPDAQAIINSKAVVDYRRFLPSFLNPLTVYSGLYVGEHIEYGVWKFLSASISGDYIIIRIQGTETSPLPSQNMVDEIAMSLDDEDFYFDYPMYASEAQRLKLRS